MSPQTIHHCLSLLRRILNRAYNWKSFKNKLPSFNGIFPKFDNTRKRFLTKKEVELIIKIINKIDYTGEWCDIILFALNTGIRKSEIFNLTFNNVNLIEKFCIITNTKSSIDRIIPLNETSYNIVIKRLKEKNNYIFHGKNSKIFYRAVKMSKINDGIIDRKQKIVFHSLRHTFASWLVQSGVPLVVVSELLGHSNIRLTQRYAHLGESHTKAAVNLLDKIIGE